MFIFRILLSLFSMTFILGQVWAADFTAESLSANKLSPQPGNPLIVTAKLRSDRNLRGRHVQLNVFKEGSWRQNDKILDKLYFDQTFVAGRESTFSESFDVPSEVSGRYSMSVTVYSNDWSRKLYDYLSPLTLVIGKSGNSEPTNGGQQNSSNGQDPTDNSQPVAQASSPYVPPGYRLNFADEFNSFNLDVNANGRSNWAPYWVGWNVRHLEGNADEALKADSSYTGSGHTPLAIKLHEKTANNTLRLYGRAMPPEKRQQFFGFPYLGGMISGQLSHSQKYGYWEVRTRLPNISKGHHIAFWLLSDDNSWPPEIDMLEVVGSDPSINTDAARFHFNSHGPNQGDISFVVSDSPRDWHVLGFLWTATDMVWYLDGKEVRRRANYVFDKQFYFLASPEIGGNWPGDPNRSTVWPMEVEIDYVRVYQK